MGHRGVKLESIMLWTQMLTLEIPTTRYHKRRRSHSIRPIPCTQLPTKYTDPGGRISPCILLQPSSIRLLGFHYSQSLTKLPNSMARVLP